MWDGYNFKFIPCFASIHAQLAIVHWHVPLRVVFPLDAFIRSHYGMVAADVPEENIAAKDVVVSTCWPGDIILHGGQAGGA